MPTVKRTSAETGVRTWRVLSALASQARLLLSYLRWKRAIPVRPCGIDDGHQKRRDRAEGRCDHDEPHGRDAVDEGADGDVDGDADEQVGQDTKGCLQGGKSLDFLEAGGIVLVCNMD